MTSTDRAEGTTAMAATGNDTHHTDASIETILSDALSAWDEEWSDGNAFRRIETFEEAMVMTRDKGLVLHMPDGTEFQVTIKQSR
jgi:hypothetical protein